ncbi:hypothetical protein [Brucella pituitosa]|uniref:hypothetical protein n=1 Tax=Brucella pituitosa TaxID=571256 RepID=UPI0009A185B8|nr:hypothetical protein [Brucella pituitosa]
MNITTIANFGARFVMRMRSGLRSASVRENVPDSNAFFGSVCVEVATGKAARLAAIWQVNPHNGHVECHWTTEPEDIAAYQALPALERFGLILAARQQNRASHCVHG